MAELDFTGIVEKLAVLDRRFRLRRATEARAPELVRS